MSQVCVRKRGVGYQYYFEVAKINGKRKQKCKGGFKTKGEAFKAGTIAFNDYLTTGIKFREDSISYNDYLDYWMKNYCEANLKYNTIRSYIVIVEKYLKPYLGEYRLSSITSNSAPNTQFEKLLIAIVIKSNDISLKNNFSFASSLRFLNCNFFIVSSSFHKISAMSLSYFLYFVHIFVYLFYFLFCVHYVLRGGV